MQIPYLIWGGSCKFCTELGGSHEFRAGLVPVFRPPQHFSNEHSLITLTGVDIQVMYGNHCSNA